MQTCDDSVIHTEKNYKSSEAFKISWCL